MTFRRGDFNYLENTPDEVTNNYQIWRLFSAVFVHYNWIHLLIALLNFYSTCSFTEKTKGTVRYFIFFWSMSVVSQIIIVLIHLIPIRYRMTEANSYGLWSMIMVQMTIEAMKNPNNGRYFC